MEKIKCINCEIKKGDEHNYLGSNVVTNGSVKEEITGRIKMQENFTTYTGHDVAKFSPQITKFWRLGYFLKVGSKSTINLLCLT
jgi:hypothetical protein